MNQTSVYSSFSDSLSIVRDTVGALGVSPYRLGWLLGVPRNEMVYRWLGCEKRVSQKYSVRLARLLIMKLLGTDFRFIKAIDWSTGQIIGKETISKMTPAHKAMSMFLDQRPL